MRPAGCQGYQHISGFDLAAVYRMVFFYDTHAESGKVIIAGLVHSGHFGGFTTDQRGTGLSATFCYTFDHIGCDISIKRTGGVIVKKKQWFCTQYQYVIDAHGDKVDADGVMFTQLYCQFQFCTHTVSARNQNRMPVAVKRQLEQAAKTAKASHHSGTLCAGDAALYFFDQFIAGIDINTGVAIT